MKRINLSALLAIAGLAFGATGARAQSAVSYSAGDLLLGFRSPNGTEEYVVDVGQASTYTSAAAPITVSGLGNIKADLDSIFGSSWNTSGTVYWSVSGTTGSFNAVGGDTAKTTYATKVQATLGTQNPTNTRWTRESTTTQAIVTNKMNGFAGSYATDPSTGAANLSTANSTKAVRRTTTVANSYASYMPGGTVANSGPVPGISFAQYNPTIEATFANGTAGSVLELYRMSPGTSGTPGDFLGTFQLDDSGTLTFTPPLTQGVVALSNATYTVAENAATGKLTVQVNRTGKTDITSSVTIGTTDGSALSGTDFGTPTPTTVSFAVNETQKTVEIPITNRAGIQGDRTFTVALSGPDANTRLGATTSATVTITEAETGVKVELASTSVSEAAGNLAVKLIRVGAAAAFTATVNTQDGTAIAGIDYTALSNATVDFTANDSEKTISVPVTNRTGVQGNRTFDVKIASATNSVSVQAQNDTQVTINDLLVPGSFTFSAATYEKLEDSTSDVLMTITVSRTGGSDGAASVDVAVTNGTAVDADYSVPSSPVTLGWNNGESGSKTFDITVKHDSEKELTETILLALQNATGGATLGAQKTATASIIDADTTVPTLTVTSPKANSTTNGSSVHFTGVAKDNSGVSKVEVALNGGAPHSMTPNAATANFSWSFDVQPEQGVNTAVVTAFDLANNPSASRTVKFTFHNVRPQLAGSYNGLVTGNDANHLFDQNGIVAVNVTSTGTFTGSVSISGLKLPIKGVFQNNGDAKFGKTLTDTFELIKHTSKTTTQPLGFLELTLDTGVGKKITGTLKNDQAVTLATIAHADLAAYSKKNPVPVTVVDSTKEKGNYTAALLPPQVVPAGTPAGYGYGSLKVTPTGGVKFVGKAADGSKVTYSNKLSADNHWPVFVPLYGKQGFVGGDVIFDPNQTDTDAAGTLTWFKPAALPKQPSYPAGWPTGVESSFIASKYVVPTSTSTALGIAAAANTTTANAAIVLTSGGLTTDTSNDVSIGGPKGKPAKNIVTVIGATSGEIPATSLTASLLTSSGTLSGKFVHPVSNKSVAYTGVAIQKMNTAYGFFLYAPVGATAESGAVGVVKK